MVSVREGGMESVVVGSGKLVDWTGRMRVV